MKNLHAWNQHKAKLALAPALIFWVVSIMCFVFGLAFENKTGISIGGVDISLIIAFTLGLANTFIQIVGNDVDKEEMGTMLFLGWIASYLFGIGSNVNYLFTLLTFSSPFLKFMVCFGLGTMIEVLPEKLFVRFLESLDDAPVVQTKPKNNPDSGRERLRKLQEMQRASSNGNQQQHSTMNQQAVMGKQRASNQELFSSEQQVPQSIMSLMGKDE